MRTFTKVSPQVWSSPAFRSLSADGRLLLLYYLTCSHQNSAGCFLIPDGYATTDLIWSLRRYQTARSALVKAGLIRIDLDTSEILVGKWFKHNQAMNASHRKHIVGTIKKIASPDLKECAQLEFQAAEIADSVSPSRPPLTPPPILRALRKP